MHFAERRSPSGLNVFSGARCPPNHPLALSRFGCRRSTCEARGCQREFEGSAGMKGALEPPSSVLVACYPGPATVLSSPLSIIAICLLTIWVSVQTASTPTTAALKALFLWSCTGQGFPLNHSPGRLETAGSKTADPVAAMGGTRSEEHTSELQSLRHLVCRLL